MLEIEQRYKVTDVDGIKATLRKNNITQTTKQHIIDEWSAPLKVQSHETQVQWFDHERGLAYRVRRTEQPDGTFAVKVETKQLTSDGNHNTFHEEVIDISDYQQALAFLTEKGYWNWLTIDKTRLQFDSHDPEIDIVLDEIDGLAEKIGVGAALEIEYQGEAETAR
jgi:adenylate cyclase class IV